MTEDRTLEQEYRLFALIALREAGERNHDMNGGDPDISEKAADYNGKRLIPWINNDKHVFMPVFDLEKKRSCINIFKLGGAYYFKHFFDDLQLFRALEQYYENQRYRFRMATAGERNKVMKILDRKGFDPTLIEDTAPFTVEISRHQKYGELLKNSVDNYPLRDKIVLVMKDLAGVEQAVAMGALVRGGNP